MKVFLVLIYSYIHGGANNNNTIFFSYMKIS